MIDWEHIRRVKFTTDEPPSGWPAGVRAISIEGVSLLGVNEKTGKLYWDGKEVLVRNRFALATYERVIAGIGVAIAGGGATQSGSRRGLVALSGADEGRNHPSI